MKRKTIVFKAELRYYGARGKAYVIAYWATFDSLPANMGDWMRHSLATRAAEEKLVSLRAGIGTP